MTVKYNDKSPGRLWYAWQKTRGALAERDDRRLRGQINYVKRTGGIGLGLIGAMGAAAYYLPLVMAVPLAWPLAAGATLVGGLCCYRAAKEARQIGKNRLVQSRVAHAEEKWLENKKNPFSKRATQFAHRKALQAGKYLGMGLGAAGLGLGGLTIAQAAGVGFVVNSAIAGAVLTGIGGVVAAGIIAGVAAPVGITLGVGCMMKSRAKYGKDKKPAKAANDHATAPALEAAPESNLSQAVAAPAFDRAAEPAAALSPEAQAKADAARDARRARMLKG